MAKKDLFEDLKQDVSKFSGTRHDASWKAARDWKDRATMIIKEVFAAENEFKDKLVKQVKGLFCSQPSCGNFEMNPKERDQEMQRVFITDIEEAKDMMDNCILKIEELAKHFN